MKHPRKTQLDNFYLESNPPFLKKQGKKALEKAKKLEEKKEKKRVRIDAKTIVMR